MEHVCVIHVMRGSNVKNVLWGMKETFVTGALRGITGVTGLDLNVWLAIVIQNGPTLQFVTLMANATVSTPIMQVEIVQNVAKVWVA